MPSLYVTEPGTILGKEGGRLVITKDDGVLLSVPAARVERVVVAGAAGVTTPALGFLRDRGIDLVFLTMSGRFRGRLTSDHDRHVALRQRQYERAGDETFCLALGRAIIAGKLHNSRTLCLRWVASRREGIENPAAAALERLQAEVPKVETREALMGIEGEAARHYFAAFRRQVCPPWQFPRRARRPPPDPVNALLSLLYTLLHESCTGALEVAGLDPGCGYLHRLHEGRASLALDLMEEFRSVIADSAALTLLNKRMLSPADFQPAAGGDGVVLNHDGWRQVARIYSRRLATPVHIPGQDRRISYQKVLEVQARRLRRAVEDGDPAYEPFRAR